MQNLESQIKAIQNDINSGKCKNIYAAKNKIRALKIRIEQIKYFNFLAR